MLKCKCNSTLCEELGDSEHFLRLKKLRFYTVVEVEQVKLKNTLSKFIFDLKNNRHKYYFKTEYDYKVQTTLK